MNLEASITNTGCAAPDPEPCRQLQDHDGMEAL